MSNDNEIMKLKRYASEKTGVPVELISGETTKEISESALAMAAYRKKSYEEAPTREKFAAWMNGSVPVDYTPDPTLTAGNKYPVVPDGGEPRITIPRDPCDAFKEWFGDVSAYDPRKDHGSNLLK